MPRLFILLLFSFMFTACQKDVEFGSLDFKTLGTASQQLLSASAYTALHIQVSYMPGFAPDAASLQHLSLFLNTYLHKPGGIHITQHPIGSSGKTVLTLKDIVQLEKQNRTLFTYGRTLAVHILITDALFNDKELLGVSYWNTSFCLFGKNIVESSGGAGQMSRTKLLTTLLQHEFGHLLGLVNQGSPMQAPHRDEENGAHCNNTRCLMYYGIETAENMSGNDVPTLDDRCRADLKANGGK